MAEFMPQQSTMPRHVAIIMDGNNRWAKQRHLPGLAGHKAGIESVRAVIEVALRQEIELLTLFAFSSENWSRPEEEVSGLMELFKWALKREVRRLHKYQVRLKIIGDRSAFSADLQALMLQAEQQTAQYQRLTLVVAANYGGRWDLTQAARQLCQKVERKELRSEQVDQALFAQYLCLAEYPEPDLCIRTSGEQRISNFLLWQMAYTEFVFAEVHWPDFRQQAFSKTLEIFAQRQRRFGGRFASAQETSL